MGCTVSTSKKKHSEQIKPTNPPANPLEPTATSLPEPQFMRSLQSAAPSFRTRVKPVLPDDISSVESDEQDELNSRFGSMKENRSPSPQGPQPLPLPPLQSSSVLKKMESFKVRNESCPLNPLPLPPMGTLRNFSYEEITAACYNLFPERSVSEGLSSVIYRASFGNDTSSSKKLEATVTCLNPSTQGLKEFVNEVNTLASLQHPNICKLIGYHVREGSEQKMLVYERLFHGSLDRLLYGRSDGPPIDWNSRMKVALCAAQGLTFLHEEGPFQAMFHEFSTTNIQIDKDFSAKLSGYGCISHIPETGFSDSSVATGNHSTKTQERGLLTPKSNVRSFGIILLELLTGRKNLDSRHPKEERNLVKWSWPYLADESRLSLIMDPRLKGRFLANAAKLVADIAQRCLKNDPSERPTMRTIVDQLKVIQEMKNPCLFPLQEPGSVSVRNTSRWPSLNRILTTQPSVPTKRALGRPLSLPPRTSSSVIVLEEIDRQVLKGF